MSEQDRDYVMQPGWSVTGLVSTSVSSAGKRSERVEKSWPSLMKVGPSCRIDSRIHDAKDLNRLDFLQADED